MNTIECCNCGCIFGVSDFWQQNKRKTKDTFYCPNGHPQSYSESSEDKMRRERDRAVQEQARLAEEVTAKDKELAKLKKRVSAGVCPCCNRTFHNVQRHMKSKHPNVVPLAQKQG